MIPIFIQIILVMLSNSQLKIITQDIEIIRGEYYLGIEISTSKVQPFKTYLNLDLSKGNTWLTYYTFSERTANNMNILSKTNLTLSNMSIISVETSESNFSSFNNNWSNTIKFYLSKKRFINMKDYLGIGFYIEDSNISFIHQLKNNGLIQHLCFGFNMSYYRNALRGKMLIGGINEDEGKYLTKKACKSDKSKKHWGCYLSSIIIGDNKIYNIQSDRNYAIFVNKSPFIKVPQDFYDLILNNYINPYLKDGNFTNIKDNIYSLNINLTTFNNLTFIFDNIKLVLKEDQLFQKILTNWLFLIKPDIEEYNEYDWVFGNSFTQNFITLFDYENEEVSFYEKKEYNNNSYLFKKIKSLFLFADIILVLNILLFIPNKISITFIKLN